MGSFHTYLKLLGYPLRRGLPGLKAAVHSQTSGDICNQTGLVSLFSLLQVQDHAHSGFRKYNGVRFQTG